MRTRVQFVGKVSATADAEHSSSSSRNLKTNSNNLTPIPYNLAPNAQPTAAAYGSDSVKVIDGMW